MVAKVLKGFVLALLSLLLIVCALRHAKIPGRAKLDRVGQAFRWREK